MSDVKWTDVGALIIAVAVPVVLHLAANSLVTQQINADEKALKQAKQVQIQNRTLDRLYKINLEITNAVAHKSIIDRENNKKNSAKFKYKYINSNLYILPDVLLVLNLYEEVCHGIQLGLFDAEIVEDLRGDALKATFKDYNSFIVKWRNGPEQSKNAWQHCTEYLNKDDEQNLFE